MVNLTSQNTRQGRPEQICPLSTHNWITLIGVGGIKVMAGIGKVSATVSDHSEE